MFGRTNRTTPSQTVSSGGGTKRTVSSKGTSKKISSHATEGSGAAPRQTTSGSSSSTTGKSKPQGDKGKTNSSSSSSSTTKGHRSTPSGGSSGSSSSGQVKKDKKDKKTGEESPEYQELVVIVFKNPSHDSYNKRHCALLIKHLDAAGRPWRRNMIDIGGYETRWRVRESVDRDPLGSASFLGSERVKSFLIGYGTQGRNDRQLRNSIYNAPIDNDWVEWNCQNWLMGALYRLVAAGFLSKAEADAAISAAFDLVLHENEHAPIALSGTSGPAV
jgi:hypothetical protein